MRSEHEHKKASMLIGFRMDKLRVEGRDGRSTRLTNRVSDQSRGCEGFWQSKEEEIYVYAKQ